MTKIYLCSQIESLSLFPRRVGPSFVHKASTKSFPNLNDAPLHHLPASSHPVLGEVVPLLVLSPGQTSEPVGGRPERIYSLGTVIG